MTRVVITGAASSIGAATAAELVRQDAPVVLPDRNADQDDGITCDVRTGGRYLKRWLTLSISDRQGGETAGEK